MPKRNFEEQTNESVKKTKVERNESHVLEIPDIIYHIAQFMIINNKPFEYMQISQAWFKTLPKTNFTLYSTIKLDNIQRIINYCKLFPNMRHSLYIHNLTTGCFSKQLKEITADSIIMSDGSIDLCDIQHLADKLKRLRINTSTIFNLKNIESFKKLKVIDLVSCIDRSNRCFQDLSLINTNYLTHFSVSEVSISDFSFVRDNISFNNVQEIVLGRSLAKSPSFPTDITKNLINLKRMILYYEHPLPSDISAMKCLKRLEVQFNGSELTMQWIIKLKNYGTFHGIGVRAIVINSCQR